MTLGLSFGKGPGAGSGPSKWGRSQSAASSCLGSQPGPARARAPTPAAARARNRRRLISGKDMVARPQLVAGRRAGRYDPSYCATGDEVSAAKTFMKGEGTMEINGQLEVPEAELSWSFARSGGPGGQNVNKV